MNSVINNINRNLNHFRNQINDRLRTAVVNFNQYVNPNNQENNANANLYPEPYIIHRQPLRINEDQQRTEITSAHLSAWTPEGRENLDFLTNEMHFSPDDKHLLFLMIKKLENLMNSNRLVFDRENVKSVFYHLVSPLRSPREGHHQEYFNKFFFLRRNDTLGEEQTLQTLMEHSYDYNTLLLSLKNPKERNFADIFNNIKRKVIFKFDLSSFGLKDERFSFIKHMKEKEKIPMTETDIDYVEELAVNNRVENAIISAFNINFYEDCLSELAIYVPFVEYLRATNQEYAKEEILLEHQYVPIQLKDKVITRRINNSQKLTNLSKKYAREEIKKITESLFDDIKHAADT